MLIQYCSDLHLTSNQSLPDWPVTAPYLVIAGNIGHSYDRIYFDFIDWVSKRYKMVFIVSGTDEYHRFDNQYSPNPLYRLQVTDARIKLAISQYHNVIHLQNETYLIPETDLVIFGSTMWTNVDRLESLTNFLIADYTQIPGFTPAMSNQLHQTTVKTLESTCAQYPTHRVIVVTHYRPSYRLLEPQYKQSPIRSLMSSNIVPHDRIVAWFVGRVDSPINIGRYHANPGHVPDLVQI
jgi:hypothetical protein